MIPENFQILGISFGIGLLVGLQRERSASQVAGIRTFPLVTLLGTVCAFLSRELGGWIFAAGLLSVTGLVISANIAKVKGGTADPGQTTEAALLLMFSVGALVAFGLASVAVVIGGAVAVLLHLKEPMHSFVKRIGEKDMLAVMQFVAISLVILPVLPNRTFGPYEVLNPYDIWRMVVLIVGIGLAGYVAYKLFGRHSGTLLTGILGGTISSTATSVSFARRTKDAPDSAALAAIVIMLATTVSVLRVLLEIGAVALPKLGQLGPPLGALLLWMIILSAGFYFWVHRADAELPEQENPAELKSALIFGALYAIILFAVAATKRHFGDSGLYVVAVLSGLTDMDAITLSTSRMVEGNRLDAAIGWRLILTAALANTVFKGVLVGMMGHKKLLARIAPLFGLIIAGGLAILWLWPESWAFDLSLADAQSHTAGPQDASQATPTPDD